MSTKKKPASKKVVRLFTDGSYRNGVGGWAFCSKDGTIQLGGFRTKAAKGAHHAELEALVRAAKYGVETTTGRIVLLSDCKTMVNVLNRNTEELATYVSRKRCRHTKNLLAQWAEITAGKNITVGWVKGHSNVKGNILADKHADKMRALGEQALAANTAK